MIWLHCGDSTQVRASLSLANRLIDQSGPETVLITSDADNLAAFDDLPTGVSRVETPQDTLSKSRAFIENWSPTYLIWNGGSLRRTLLKQVEKSKIPATLINARLSGLFAGGSGWNPLGTRKVVSVFERILTADGATATRLTRGGVPTERTQATGPILEEPLSLPHNRYELTVMAEALDTRPVWLAANVAPDEVADIAAAHLAASRKNHRMLLVLTPRNPDDGAKSAEFLRRAGFKVAVRSEGEDPEPEQQVYVADLPDELGMWYRLIPLTFMGGTLRGGGASSPLEPILLGSAVIHGTRKSPHKARFERLAKSEACREVRSTAELGIAVSVLISPEQTARMALAGWDEITRNARTINTIIEGALNGIMQTEGTP